MDVRFGSFLSEKRSEEELLAPALLAQEIEKIRYGLFVDGWAVFICPNVDTYRKLVIKIRGDLERWSNANGKKYAVKKVATELEQKVVIFNTRMVRIQQLEPLVVCDVIFAA